MSKICLFLAVLKSPKNIKKKHQWKLRFAVGNSKYKYIQKNKPKTESFFRLKETYSTYNLEFRYYTQS